MAELWKSDATIVWKAHVDDRHEVDSDCDSDQTLGADNLNINNNWETTIEWILVGLNVLHCSSVGAHEQSTY